MITIETRKERHLRDKKRMTFLENSGTTKEAKEAFKRKPYRESVPEYLARKYNIGNKESRE